MNAGVDMSREVLVVIGAGGLGLAIARRQGPGKSILLADLNEATLQAGAQSLEHAGHSVTTQKVDLSSRESVKALALAAERMGPVMQLAQAAGVSPTQASPPVVLAVDLLGTALVLEEFGRVIARGGAGVHISSMAGHRGNPLDPAHADALAHTPADELLKLPFLDANSVPTSTVAYEISKRANALRVQSASVLWGDRGARLNSISPGIILTALARDELAGPRAPIFQDMIKSCAAGRVGTPDEVAAVAAFLLGPEAGFITGSDLLMDGGVIAALRSGRWSVKR
jgi:NAD(P)-dependent dehydrogenase (short-subunit alcohol dehydrogenase family)